jgi:hypothetical protein
MKKDQLLGGTKKAKTAQSEAVSSMTGSIDCEWCGTEMTAIRGRRKIDENTSKYVGQCPSCCTQVWSVDVDESNDCSES